MYGVSLGVTLQVLDRSFFFYIGLISGFDPLFLRISLSPYRLYHVRLKSARKQTTYKKQQPVLGRPRGSLPLLQYHGAALQVRIMYSTIPTTRDFLVTSEW